MAELTFKDNGEIIVSHNGKVRFGGRPIQMKDDELYQLIQAVSRIKDVLLEENKSRPHKIGD